MRRMRSLLRFPLVLAPMALIVICATVAWEAESSGQTSPAATSGAVASPAPAPGQAAPPAKYIGSKACAECHDDVAATLNQGLHGAAAAAAEQAGRGHECEGCHGPGSRHADDPADKKISGPMRERARSGDGCLSCHDTHILPVRWKGSEHKRAGVVCLDCHLKKGQPHGEVTQKPTSEQCLWCHQEKRGEFALPSHHPVPEGRIDCSDCHNPHQAMGREMKRDICLPCHTDRRGPFVFEHGALSGDLTDECLECHRPHGSPNQKLFKLANRGLCLQCHADKGLHHFGPVCWDCHQAVHGSNSSPLLFTE